ncbi:energy transducer TonB [Pseudomonas aeruginosa]|nr:energy transducer TonB [Pseudomonas aeruginosa]EKX8190049.1 energy transducer TonB [Pseudomonas aeruginosa]
MITTRIFFISIIAPLAGCATTAVAPECSKEEMVAWGKANGAAIGRQLRYPSSARASKQEGKAIVSLSVNTDGTVSQCSIKQSAGFPVLDKEACNIMNGKYSTPVCGGKNAPMTVDVPIVFSVAE